MKTQANKKYQELIWSFLYGSRFFKLMTALSTLCLVIIGYTALEISDQYKDSVEIQKEWNSFTRQLEAINKYLQATKTPLTDFIKNKSVTTEKIQLELAGSAMKRHIELLTPEIPVSLTETKPEISKKLQELGKDHLLLVDSGLNYFRSSEMKDFKKLNEYFIVFNDLYSKIDLQFTQIDRENQLELALFLSKKETTIQKLSEKIIIYSVALFSILIIYLVSSIRLIHKKEVLSNTVLQNNKVLTDQTSNLKTLLDLAPVGIYQTNLSGDCIAVNKKWCEIAGLTEEQALGGGWYLAIHPDDRHMLSEKWKSFVLSEAPFNCSYRFQNSSGLITYVQGEAVAVKDSTTNEVKGYIGTILDRTNEHTLNQSMQFYRHAIDQSVIVTVADHKGNITYVNDAFCEISQFTSEEVLGKNHRILNSDFHTKEMWSDFWRCISNGFVWKGQVRNKKKDGTFYWVDTTVIPYRGLDGKNSQYYSIRKDITPFKELEQRLENKTSYLSAIMDNSNYAIIATDLHGTIMTFNKSAERILGYKAEELINKQTPAVFHDPSEVIKHSHKLEAELMKPVPVGFETFIAKAATGVADENEWTYIDNNGNRIPVLLSVTAIRNFNNEITGYLGVAADLTLQKQKDTQFLNLVQNLPAAIYRTEVNNFWSLEFISDALEQITGYRSTEFLKNNARNFSSIIFPDDLEYVRQSIIAAVENDLPYLIEYRIISKSGEIKWVFERGSAHTIQGEKSSKYLDGAIFDITHMKATEFELKSQKSFIEKITNAIPSIIYVSSVHEGKIVYSNRNLFEFLGYSSHQEQKNHIEFFKKIIHPDDAHLLNGRRQQWLTSKLDILDSKEFRVKHHNGHYLWLRDKTLVFRRDDNGLPLEIIGILDDITISKKLQQDLEDEKLRAVHSSKMASLGEMAGGVSHEINNPLSIIEGNAAKIIRVLEKDTLDIEELKKAAGKIESTTERIAKIIRGLRSFSRDGAKDPFVPTTIKSLIDETLSFCEARLTNHRIQLKINPFDPDLKIDCRGVQLSQVILNLINNSSDAIQSLSNPWIQLNIQDLGSNIEISVTDSGKGIPTEVAEKIMQPFFTTKGIGKGTGLGLSINKGIIESHQGKFYLDTDCPNTRFVIELPKKHHFSLKKTG